MNWNTLADFLRFHSTPIRATPQKATERQILRQSSRIYDPLGLHTPVTVRAKILIQGDKTAAGTRYYPTALNMCGAV
ncbi:hypothetical protein DPMN_016885 [Dreissena polymorpha]|uniref:Uncharacterized protein n=1 Tax=Dreissena polymorpha TaxID=45954 RepID=A0A9D4S7K9_DREPO|nr:hypothetical protein DPMN_016885 [Dreissena polymorpha]